MRSSEAYSSAESGLRVRKSGRPVSSKRTGRGTGSEELWIFLPRNRIICQVENSLYLDRGSAMNASFTELHRKIRWTAGRAPSEAAECGPAASKMRLKRGG